MYPILVIRCNDEKTVNEIALLLQRELRIRDYVVEIASLESIYYGMSNLAEDISGVKMLTIDPPSDEGE
jgi:hypothetical protein